MNQSSGFDEHIRAAEAALEAARRRLADEITSYPGPIAGCDAQFNHLLAQRTRVNAALAALALEVRVPTPRAP